MFVANWNCYEVGRLNITLALLRKFVLRKTLGSLDFGFPNQSYQIFEANPKQFHGFECHISFQIGLPIVLLFQSLGKSGV